MQGIFVNGCHVPAILDLTSEYCNVQMLKEIKRINIGKSKYADFVREQLGESIINLEYEVSTTFLKEVNCVDTIDIFTSVHVSIPSGMQ